MAKVHFTQRELDVMSRMNVDGMSSRKIAKFFNCSSPTVCYWNARGWKISPRPLGRRSAARRERVQKVKRVARARVRGAFSVRDAKVALQNATGVRVSRSTVYRDLRAAGFVPRRRPRTTVWHGSYAVRAAFCRANRKFVSRRLIFTDEKIFTTNDNTGNIEWCEGNELASRRLVLRFPAGRVQVWGAIGVNFRHLVVFPHMAAGPEGPAAFRLTAIQYQRRCLQGVLVNHAVDYNCVLQQDGASSHWAGSVRKYLANKGVELLQNWPAHSPGLSPIETLWAKLARDVSLKAPSNRQELEAAIWEAWNELDVGYVNRLVLSFNKRCEGVIAKGGVQ